jgi:very-short-patch-repair endonuclease
MKQILIARKLRKNQTVEEKIFWEAVRNRRLFNLKFLRQYPIIYFFEGRKGYFFADFYCAELKLIIEIDGKYHEFQQDYDKLRERIIIAHGIKIIRFTNEEIRKKLDEVLYSIPLFG